MKTFRFGLLILSATFVSTSGIAQESRYTGLIFSERNVYESIPLAARPHLGILPNSYDMSAFFPPPGNQGIQGSCVGWAVAYALKGYQEKVERNWTFNSSRHLFSPAYVFNQIKLKDCDGAYFTDAFDLITREGVATLDEFPYDPTDCSKQPTALIKQNAQNYAIASWRRVNVQDVTEIKSHIALGFPVLVGIEVDNSFEKLNGTTIYNSYSQVSLGGHALVIVGYDDSMSAFRLINSWGTAWGDNGFGWISYGAFRQIVREGYVTQDIVAQPHVPNPPDINPVQDQIQITSKAYLTDRNTNQYNFKISILASSSILNTISAVTYKLNHQTLNYATLTSSDPQSTFTVGYQGWGCLRSVTVTIYYRDGTNLQVNHDMCASLGW